MDIKKLREKSEKVQYNIESVNMNNFEFHLEKIVGEGTLIILHFYLVEKEVNFIHKMKIAIQKEAFITACYLTFYNPLKKETVVNLSHNINDFDKNMWFIPLILEYEENLKSIGFPFDKYIEKIK